MSATTDRIHVLHVDDEPDFANMAAEFLKREDDRISVQTATNAREGLDVLADSDIDCIVSDHDMPGRNGIEFLETVRETYPDLPFILYTGKGSEAVASDAISAGVTDYLQKESGIEQYEILANDIVSSVQKYWTERKFDALRRRYTKLVEQNFVGIYIIQNWEFVYVNPRLAEIHGYDDPEQIVGMSPLDFVVPEEREKVQSNLERRFAGEVEEIHYQTIGLRKDGERIDIELHGSQIEYEGDSAVIGAELDITERKKRERELETVLEGMNDAVFVHGEDTSFKYVNQTAVERYGYEESDLYEMYPQDLATPEEAEKVANRIERIMREGGLVFETELQPAGEESFPVEMNSTPITFRGKPAILSIARDITERKEREQQIRKLKDKYQSFVEYSSDIITLIDADGTIQYVNPAVERMFGFDSTAREGDRVDEYIHPEDHQQVIERFQEFVSQDSESTERVEFRYEDPDGSYRWLESIGVDKTDTEIDGYIVYSRDITERKEREQELEQRNQELREREEQFKILHSAGEQLIQATSREQAAKIAIDAAKNVLGYTRGALRLVDENEEILRVVATTKDNVAAAGKRPDYLVDEDVPAARAYRHQEPEVYDDLTDSQDEYNRGALRSGLYVPVGENGVFSCGNPETNAYDETDVNILEVLMNLTATALTRIESEHELRQKNNRLEKFASLVSHDLRNPLNVAQGRIDLAREESESEHLDDAANGIERGLELIDDMLTLARAGEQVSDQEPIEVADLVQTCWDHVEAGDASIVADIESTIRADRSRLRQLLENLLRNAIEHGGDVTVTVGELADGFYVEDDGPGISKNEREEVFEAGYSTSKEGPGVGLSIVKEIVEGHNWEITATKGSEGGARFEITGVEFTAE